MEYGPSVHDIRFTSNTWEVNEAFENAIALFGLEEYCFVNNIEDRFRGLRKSANSVEAANATAPPNSLVLDVIGDGDCLPYSILSLWLGWPVPKDHVVVAIFKKHFVNLVRKHRKKIVYEGEKPMPKSEKPHLVTFNHAAYVNCCDEYEVNGNAEHNDSFGRMYNSDQGWLEYRNLDEWCDIVEMPHTWLGDQFLRLVSCLSGFSFFTNNYRCGSQHPDYYSYVPQPKYGFQKAIPGGEILLQWINSNHYQVLVPKYPDQLDTTVHYGNKWGVKRTFAKQKKYFFVDNSGPKYSDHIAEFELNYHSWTISTLFWVNIP